eukprot:GHVN01078229.1.p1 GENE.GHVN01078229.1~~GHVN01078229.1.p1  ORF type:complete len:106 (-),score=15.73 GHVN01078229.1:82-399(-)
MTMAAIGPSPFRLHQSPHSPHLPPLVSSSVSLSSLTFQSDFSFLSTSSLCRPPHLRAHPVYPPGLPTSLLASSNSAILFSFFSSTSSPYDPFWRRNETRMAVTTF